MLPTKVSVWRDGGADWWPPRTSSSTTFCCSRAVTGSRPTPWCFANRLLVDTSMLTGESVAGAGGGGDLRRHVRRRGGRPPRSACDRRAHPSRGDRRADHAVRQPDTPLTRELNAVVRLIAAIALGVGALFLLVSLLVGNPLEDGFVFAIGVTVALVPEALPPTVTLSLAWAPSRCPSGRSWCATSRRSRPSARRRSSAPTRRGP